VQTRLKRDQIVRSEMKEFAFTRLIACGLCGSSISAMEKFKKHKDGTTARYVYYGCSRGKDRFCKGQYVREEELINQLAGIIDKIDINELGVKYKLEEEIERYRRFRNIMSGAEQKPEEENAKGINLRAYIKYLLKSGSTIEKREVLVCIKSKLVLTKKILKAKN
jgi:hypothetical protein